MAIIPYINPSRLKCDPETARCLRELCVVVNNYLRRYNFVHTGNEQYELIADPSLVVRNVSGTTIVSDVGEIRFDQSDGFTVTEVSAGIARIDFTAPPVPPTLTVRESDNSVIVSNVGDLAFNQATGFTVTDLTGGAARVGLVFIPPDSVIPGTVDDSAFTESLAPVTKICREIMHINGTVTIAAVEYPVTFSLSTTSNTYSVPVVTDVSYETKLTTLIDGTTIDAPTCHYATDDCCQPCADCTCEGYEPAVELGTSSIIDEPVTSHDGVAPGEFLMSWTSSRIFCVPSGTCDYTVDIQSIVATVAGTCIDPSSFGSPNATLTVKEFTGCAEGATVDTATGDGACPQAWPALSCTIPATATACEKFIITLTLNYYSDTDDAAAVLDYDILIVEGPC